MQELKRVIDQGAQARHNPRKAPIYITEFGISTKPPDQKYGVSLERAAALLNQADRYMWLDKRVRMVSQFEYEDDIALNPPTFQTGLRYGANGAAKPSLQAFRLPVFVMPDKKSSKRVIVWGWVRAAKNARQQVVIQNRRETYGEWSNVRTVTTDAYGFLNVKVDKLKGSWRLAWVRPADGAIVLAGSRAWIASTARPRPGLLRPDQVATRAARTATTPSAATAARAAPVGAAGPEEAARAEAARAATARAATEPARTRAPTPAADLAADDQLQPHEDLPDGSEDRRGQRGNPARWLDLREPVLADVHAGHRCDAHGHAEFRLGVPRVERRRLYRRGKLSGDHVPGPAGHRQLRIHAAALKWP